MGTAIKHPGQTGLSRHLKYLTPGHSCAQPWASECPDVKNYKWRRNSVWHRMLYSCTHMAAVDFTGLPLHDVYTSLYNLCLTLYRFPETIK